MHYRIKLKNENKFSNCRNKPSFTKNGKIITKQHLMVHLRAVMKREKNLNVYDNCSLEECSFIQTNDEFFDDIKRQVQEKLVVDILKGVKI